MFQRFLPLLYHILSTYKRSCIPQMTALWSHNRFIPRRRPFPRQRSISCLQPFLVMREDFFLTAPICHSKPTLIALCLHPTKKTSRKDIRSVQILIMLFPLAYLKIFQLAQFIPSVQLVPFVQLVQFVQFVQLLQVVRFFQFFEFVQFVQFIQLICLFSLFSHCCRRFIIPIDIDYQFQAGEITCKIFREKILSVQIPQRNYMKFGSVQKLSVRSCRFTNLNFHAFLDKITIAPFIKHSQTTFQ